MKTYTYFDTLWGSEWPDVEWFEPYFRVGAGGKAPVQLNNGGGTLRAEDIRGTMAASYSASRVDADLRIWGNLAHGVSLDYTLLVGGTRAASFLSKGDLRQRLNWVWQQQGVPLSVGLFIPVEQAWNAVRQFVQTGGELPNAIEWIAESDLPSDTFPEPQEWQRLKYGKTHL